MDYVRLGSTGLKVSRICLGTLTFGSPQWRDWVLDEERSRPIIARALELGVNFFDTANSYSLGESESILGRALKDFAPDRAAVVIATKVYDRVGDGPNEAGLSRKHIMRAIDDSLRRLGTDFVDLYQIHRFDPATPIEETLEALTDIVRAGKALHVGASSMYAWQFAKMLSLSDRRGSRRFVSMQCHYNLIYREEEREMLPLCRDEGIGILPWSPLAHGLLARDPGKSGIEVTRRARSDSWTRENYDATLAASVAEQIAIVARDCGASNAQVGLAWLLHKAGVVAPVIGASRAQHVEEAVRATKLKLGAEQIASLEWPYKPRPIVGHE
jgi:1-deoxyxylulose-5-phosphate synthase